MSLPVGHALVGSLVFAALDRRVRFCSRRAAWLLTLTLPSLPDLDFGFVWFLGFPDSWHRFFTHSLFFAAGVGALAALWVRTRGREGPGWAFLFVTLLVASHDLVDMVGYGPDDGPGGGVMLLWPATNRFYELPWQFLPPGAGESLFWYLRTAWMELFFLGPPVAIVWAIKRWRADDAAARRRGRADPAA
jgi:membrane-bound metal-dependent hydrolase YbcI (DUF457 family)